MQCDLWISKFKKEQFPWKLYEEIWYVPDLIQGYISLFTEREALEESKAKFVELQKIAVNKRKLTEKKEKDL